MKSNGTDVCVNVVSKGGSSVTVKVTVHTNEEKEEDWEVVSTKKKKNKDKDDSPEEEKPQNLMEEYGGDEVVTLPDFSFFMLSSYRNNDAPSNEACFQ